MYEIERKFRLDSESYEQLKTTLEARYGQAEPIIQTDQIYSLKPSMLEHVKGDPLTRIRQVGATSIFTYKITKLDTGNRIEHEMTVGDPEVMAAALEAMGWQLVSNIKKSRLSYRDGDVNYELDIVETIGHFLEIEMVQPTDDSDGEQKIIDAAEALGISAGQIEYRNYPMLVELAK